MLYLHIGSNKTGSSALQLFLLENRLILSRLGFEYPEHHVDENLISSGNGDIYCSDSIPNHEKRKKQLLDNVTKNKLYKIVLSSEKFYLTNPHKIKNDMPFRRAIVIVYIRRQDSWSYSRYNQRIKRHLEKLKCSKWIDHFCLDKNKYYSYYPIDRWSDCYGKDNIIVRPYEKQQFYGGNIFSDFLHHLLGIELTSEFTLPKRKINKSYSKHATEYKRLVNCLSSQANTLEKPLQAYSDLLNEGDDWLYEFISPVERLKVIRNFEKRNHQVAREYLNREDGRLFYDTLPDPNEPWEPYPGLSEEKVIKITRFLAKRSPNVIPILTKGILNGLESDEPEVKEAAEILIPALKYNKQICYSFIKNLRKSLTRLSS